MSFLITSKTSSNALGPSSYVLEWILSGGGFLYSNLSPVFLGGLAILYSCLLVLAVNWWKSFSSSVVVAFGAVGTKERPLLSRIFCALERVRLDRLTMFCTGEAVGVIALVWVMSGVFLSPISERWSVE